MNQRTCIAIDQGRSATKVVAFSDIGKTEVLFSSAFSKAGHLSDQASIQRAEPDAVEVSGTKYWVGPTAILQGRDDMIAGLSDTWVFGDHHAALLLSALKRLAALGVPGIEKAIIAVGLPAKLFGSQHKKYRAAITNLVNSECAVHVLPQSMGPYYQRAFTDDIEVDADHESKVWGVVEVGQYTTDFAMIDKGTPNQWCFGSCDGMRIAAENLQKEILNGYNTSVSFVEATELLACAELKEFGRRYDVHAEVAKSVEPLAQIIVNNIQSLFGASMRTMDGVILAGGGASLIRDAIAARWQSTASGQPLPADFICVTPNPRFAVAEGFAKYARAVSQI